MRVGKISNAEIERAMTAKGGWTKATLAKWGVPWPPPRGWREAITKRDDQRRQPENYSSLRCDCVFPDFEWKPAGSAPPVILPPENCMCGRVATRRVYFSRWSDRWPKNPNDPCLAACDDCAAPYVSRVRTEKRS